MIPGEQQSTEHDERERELDKLIQGQGGPPALTPEQVKALLTPPADP